MTDKIQQSRRELFEAWTKIEHGNLIRRQDGEYFDDLTHGAWLGFNAALDCVVIELPADCKLSRDGLDECYFAGQMRDDILHAIESTNLGIKVK